MHRLEIEELRKALDDRACEMQRMEQEKERTSSEKDNVARTVAGLEADLQRVKRDAEAFGKDLQALRAEKENLEARSKDEITKAERAKKQAQAQIRILTEQLNTEKDRASKAIGQLESRSSVVSPIQSLESCLDDG
jgi:chromosome segregation ATPase